MKAPSHFHFSRWLCGLFLLTASLWAGSVRGAGEIGDGAGAPGLMWQTGGAAAFACANWPDAQGPPAAVVTLAPGQEAWIETTLTGAGFLDYTTLCDASCPAPQASQAWSVRMWNAACYIPQGRTAPLTVVPEEPEDLTVVRWTVRAPANAPATTRWALRGVQWTPVPLVPQQGYQAWRLSEGTGPAGGRALLCVPDPSESATHSISVTGPATVRWRSLPPSVSDYGSYRSSIQVNGGTHLGLSSYRSSGAWLDHELALPAGIHTVQWILRGPEGYDEDDSPYVLYPTSAYRMTEPEVVAAVSAKAEALDQYGLLILTEGAATVTSAAEAHDNTDALRLTPGARLQVAGNGPGWLSLKFRRVMPGATWEERRAFYGAGPFVWEHDVYSGQQGDDVVDEMRFTALTPVALDAAVECPGLSAPLNGIGRRWEGLAGSDFAHDVTDAAVSVITGEGIDSFYFRELNLSATGPARLSFWWRATGPAELQLLFNNHVLPVSSPSGGIWQHFSFLIPPGAQTITWRHTARGAPQASSAFAEAALDEISLESSAEIPLAKAIGTPGREFIATGQTGTPGWQSLAWSINGGALTSCVAAPGSRYASSNTRPSLSTTVAGPAVVSFRWRCRTTRADLSSNVRWQPAEFQMVVDDTPVRAIPADGHEEWVTTSQYISPGSHRVTWQNAFVGLAPTYDLLFSHYIRDVTITTPAQHYAQWSAGHQLPPGQPSGQDTDGDGMADLMEYALGLDPRAPDAAASQLSVVTHGDHLRLIVPRPEGVMPVVVECSVTLAGWTAEYYPVAAGVPLFVGDAMFLDDPSDMPPSWSRTPQFFALPPNLASHFFRLKVTGGDGVP